DPLIPELFSFTDQFAEAQYKWFYPCNQPSFNGYSNYKQYQPR
ncbi:9209_t:CDS:1, partial [Paraglomus occultum]